MRRQDFFQLRIQITGFQKFVLEVNLPSLVSQCPTATKESFLFLSI